MAADLDTSVSVMGQVPSLMLLLAGCLRSLPGHWRTAMDTA